VTQPAGLSVEALIEAPAGVALLARIEAEEQATTNSDAKAFPWWESPRQSDPEAVERAATRLAEMSFGSLLELAVSAAYSIAGPWNDAAPSSLAFAYELAERRRPIASAIVERFGAQLGEKADPDCQEWWNAEASDQTELSTFTHPPPEVHGELVGVSDVLDGRVSRWRLPVTREVRIWDIDRPSDWVALVEAYPAIPESAPYPGWELPAPNQHRWNLQALPANTNQHAARSAVRRRVSIDWDAVAADYQGLHLSWAGFLTTEGYISDLGDGDITMLRHWGSEATIWFDDVFGDPIPLPPVEISHLLDGKQVGIDLAREQRRKARDTQVLKRLLGRLP
jgi:hypothetical protein